MRSIFVEQPWKIRNFWCYFTVTQWILLRLQIGDQKLKEHPKLHILHIEHFVIQSELKQIIRAQVLSSQKWGTAVCNTKQKKPQFWVWFGVGTTHHLVVPVPGGSRSKLGPQFKFELGQLPSNPESLLILFQEHLRIYFPRLSTHWLAPGGPGSIRM
jgi:hypothetical protein